MEKEQPTEGAVKQENYKGFVIEALRVELQNNLGWSALLLTKKYNKDGVTASVLR